MIPFCLSIYRRLARAFPHEFQMVYGADIVQLGEDAIADIARAHGILGLILLLADLAWRIPVEYLSEMRHDLLYAVRMLMKSPGLAVAAVVSLGLGIGVPTAGFSEINAFFFRDLPGAKDPDRLVTTEKPTSYIHYERYRDHRDLFAGVAAYMEAVPFNAVIDGKTERVFGHVISPDYFDVIGVHATPGVVVSERFWNKHAGVQTMRLNGRAITVAGVAPKDFLGAQPVQPADIFVPVSMLSALVPELGADALTRSDLKDFTVLLRLQPGVTIQSANAAAETIARLLADKNDNNEKGQHVRLIPGGGVIPRTPELMPVLLGFLGTLMALILGIACTNLANMLLARAAGRRREIAIRLAVGASRFRLIRQLLAESVLLALCGGVAGFAFAYWLMVAATKMYNKFPMPIPLEVDLRPDWHVFLFTFGLAVIAGVGFGLAPALTATKTDFGPALKEGAVTQLRGYRRFGLRNLLMVYQVAGSLTVLIITGFVVLGFSGITKSNAAFDTSNLFLMSIDPVRDGYAPEKTAALFQKVRDRLRDAPGIENASISESPAGSFFPVASTTFVVPASASEPAKVIRLGVLEHVGAGYFATLRVRMPAGREFTSQDEMTNMVQPAVISSTAATAMFGADNPIGRRIENEGATLEVIGVAPDLRGRVLNMNPSPEVWIPLGQRADSRPLMGGLTLTVRAVNGADALTEIRHQIALIDPNLTLFNVRTMTAYLDQANNLLQSTGFVYGSFGVFGLVLASIGLAGVTAYSVARRRQEIGIRMALGARPAQVLRLVMKEGAALVIIGSVLGFLGAWAIARLLSSLSPEMAETLKTKQPLLMFGAPLLLASLAMLACYFPARRSTKVDPLQSLRQE